jgi:hypothetical protein
MGTHGSRASGVPDWSGEGGLTAIPSRGDNRFKTDSDYAEEVEIATIHRALETLRAAMNWGMAQTPASSRRSAT